MLGSPALILAQDAGGSGGVIRPTPVGGGQSQPPEPPTPPPAPEPSVPQTPPPVPATPAGDQSPAQPPAAAPPGGNQGAPTSDADMFVFNFHDAVDLSVLVDYVREQLDLPIIATDSGLKSQQVIIPAPVRVPREDVLKFLNALLALKGYTIIRGPAGLYLLQPVLEVTPMVTGNPLSPTRVIPTRGLKPTSLIAPLQVLSSGGQGGKAAQIVPMDELGVILVTASPAQSAQISDMVDRLAQEQAIVRPMRFELRHISGSYARERILDLSGTPGARGAVMGAPMPAAAQPGTVQPAAPAGAGSTLSPFQDRLTVDPQGNALYFRGREDEISYLTRLLAIVDVPNALQSKWYPVGKAARTVATAGQREGLGDVTVEESTADQQQRMLLNNGGVPIVGQPQVTAAAGPGFTIYPDVGGFMYRGTSEQQQRVEQLVNNLSGLTRDELVVFEFYKLKHTKAEDVADLIHNLLTNQTPSASSTLLGGQQRGTRGTTGTPTRPGATTAGTRNPNSPANPTDAGGALLGIEADENTFVLADKANNQVVVKAPKRLQSQFARLIQRLDLRRPQVYVDAKIVAITATDDFRLAFETQLINAAGHGGVLNTNFGLSSFAQNGQITDRKDVVTSLLGATAAYIRADQVPIILTALSQTVDTRIVSSPQLLVDDNVEASVDSVEQQPYATTIQTAGNPLQTSLGGQATAGTKLKITPQISEGDYLKLKYEVELSSFEGSGSNGLPPPSQVNTLSSESVTVPSDTAIVVGGLTFDQVSDTINKVPLLGDIPFVGYLFRDTKKDSRKTTLYVFITPRIMKDPTFGDLRLLTRGPRRVAELPEDLPKPEPIRIEIIDNGAAAQSSPGRVTRGG